MSKLAVIQQYRYSPAAGGIFGSIIKGVGKFIKGGIQVLTKSKAAKVAATVARNPVAQTAAVIAAGEAAGALMSGGGGGGATGSFGYRRRSRGITARELRGYRKVANLLHKEGMVSKRARGRH